MPEEKPEKDILGEEEIDEDREEQLEPEEKQAKPGVGKWIVLLALFLFLLALVPRLYFIFRVSNPDNPGAGWFGDAYHHWQIAYLTKEIGFSKRFLRLWDLKGMEYFWGLLHPVVTMLGFQLTGNASVGTERAITAIFGSISVVLIFLLVRRFWNLKAAFAASIFAALNPIGIFNDGTGMVEPLGIPFLLFGILAWPSKPIWAGVSFAIAAMARAEYWVFAVGLVAAMIIRSKRVKFDPKVLLFGGFFVVLGLYMKYLLNHTGNAIYPLYWNYMANVAGEWQHKLVLSPEDIQAKYIFLSIFIATAVLSLLVLWRRPKGMFLYLLGLGNWVFLGALFGLGEYIKSYADWIWYTRFVIFPYAFLGIVLSIFLFYLIPKIRYIKILDKIQLTSVVFLAALVAAQAFWIPIWNKYSSTGPAWQQAVRIGNQIAEHYEGGGLLIIEGNPEITYALVRNNGVEGKNIVGQMFDPYYYFEEGKDPYDDWDEKRKIVLNWLKEYNIRTIATYTAYERYTKLAEKEPQFISEGVPLPNSALIIYQVKDELHQTEIR